MSRNLLWLRLAIVLLNLSIIGLAFIGGIKGYSPVPYWDMWGGTLEFVDNYGDAPLRALFEQHNEHRIAISRLLFLIDYHLFNGTHVFLIMMNYLITASTWCVLSWCLLRLTNGYLTHPDRRILILILGSWLFLWAQKENFTWAFQSQFFLAQLLPLLAFLALNRAAFQRERSNTFFCIAVLFGLLSPLSLASGVFVLPLMVFGSLLLRIDRLRLALLVSLSLVVLWLYLHDFRSPSAHGNILSSLSSDPAGLVRFILNYLGNPSIHIAGSSSLVILLASVVGGSFFLITTFLTVRAILNKPSDAVSVGLILFCIYVVAGAFVTAAGRLPFGVNAAFTSRYTTPVLISWAALFCLASPHLMRFHTKTPIRPYVSLIAALIATLLLSVGQLRALTNMDSSNNQKMLAAFALEIGIADRERIALVYHDVSGVLSIAQHASNTDLGIFGRQGFAGARELFGDRSEYAPEQSCWGGIDQIKKLPADPDYVMFTGRQLLPDNTKPDQRINVVDDNDKIVGLALSGLVLDSPQPEPISNPRSVNFSGYMRSDSSFSDLRIYSSACKSASVFEFMKD